MPTLLHIESSPRKTRSASLDVARAYLEAYRDAHPDHSIDVLDLWAIELPEFDGDALDAKYADLSGTQLSEAQQGAWEHPATRAAVARGRYVTVLRAALEFLHSVQAQAFHRRRVTAKHFVLVR